MADFPSLTPTIRPLTPGRWGGATLASMSGQTSTVRRSSAEIGRRVSLRFENITEAQFLDIVNHYRGQRSGLDGFNFNSATIPTAYTPSGHTWLYAGPPQVVDRHQDVFTVELECRSEPRGPFRVSGVAFTTLPALTAGAPTAILSGLAISRTPTLAAGSMTAILSGLAGTISPALAAGSPTAIVPGAALSSVDTSVSLLLHFDGSNGSTTITDSSSNQLTLVAYGNAQISTTQSKFGGTSLYLDGSGDYVRQETATTIFDFSSGAFTVEAWTYQLASKLVHVVSYREADWRIDIGADQSVRWVTPFAERITSSASAAPLNQWNHLAASSDGTTTTLYVNGTSVGTTTQKPASSASSHLNIGRNPATTARDFNGYIDELRLTKGIARYSANFTPPAQPFPDPGTASLTAGTPTAIVTGASYGSITTSLAAGTVTPV